MKPIDYDLIPKRKNLGLVNVPGVYCKSCGKSFELYSFSILKPNSFDENDKPYYDKCFDCLNKP
jgi:hypothetical protein